MANQNAKQDDNGHGGLLAVDETTGETRRVKATSAGALLTTATLTGDVEIGAVEIKDGTTDQRAVVDAQGRLSVVASGVSSFAEDSAHTSGALGTFIMAVRNDSGAVFTDTNGDYSPISVDNQGRLMVNLQTGNGNLAANAASGAKSSVPASASSVQILAANSVRKKFSVYNDSSVDLYLDETGGTASATSFTTRVPPNTKYESQPGPVYTGIVTGIWASATGNARVGEW